MLPGMTADASEVARRAAAAAALERLAAGMTIGLGSGRAVWAVIDAARERWPDGPPLRAALASTRTEEIAREAGIEVVKLDGSVRLELAIDGADEVDPDLGLIKGGGGALLREKIVVAAAERFLVVAETPKRVGRLGETRGVPVEVVRFGWRDTRRRLLELLEDAELREAEDGSGPYLTDEQHFILDCGLPSDADLAALAAQVKATPGVVEHGLFLGMASEVLLGRPDGGVDVLRPG
jgi:ribose 5-phosphate isomerase A